jgi:rod shape determining protein RodA
MLVPVFFLFALSLLILGSLSMMLAVNQLIFIILGLALYFLVSRYPWQQHQFLGKQYFYLTIALLLLPYLFGVVTRGSIRWIPLGSFSLQPSELVKPLLIINFSWYLSRFKKNLDTRALIRYAAIVIIPFLLIFKQPDLGTSLVVLAIGLGLLLLANLSRRQLIVLVIGAGLAASLSWWVLKPYQRERLTGFINPYADPAGSGYQVIQATIAVGDGGWFGQGLGRGSQSQLKFLPERQTDFVFASLAEELGLISGVLLLFAYWRLFKILIGWIQGATDQFASFVIAGVLIMIWFQAAVSIAMNLGVMPVTGITLPLVSAGGSSLLATMISLGLAVSAAKASQNKKTLEIS